MGGFGNIARSIGGVGNDVFTAQQTLADIQQRAAAQKLADLQTRLGINEQQQMLPLKLQQLRQQIAAQQPKPQFTSLTELEAYAVQSGNAPLLKQVQDAQRASQKGPVTPYADWHQQNPDKPVADWLALQQAQKPDKAPAPYADWRAQNPTAPVSDWLKLQEKYKKTAASEGGPVDDLISDIIEHRAAMPTGKLAVQIAQRAKELGLTLPSKDPQLQKMEDSLVTTAQLAGNVHDLDKTPDPNGASSLTIAEAHDKLFGGNLAAVVRAKQTSWWRGAAFSADEKKQYIADIERINTARRALLTRAYEKSGQTMPEWLSEGTAPPTDASDLGGTLVNP